MIYAQGNLTGLIHSVCAAELGTLLVGLKLILLQKIMFHRTEQIQKKRHLALIKRHHPESNLLF